MGRKKICPTSLRESGTQRKETFSKRTRGLFKKAHELASMCGCALHIAVASEDGRLFHMHRLRNPQLDEFTISSNTTSFLLDLPPVQRQYSAVVGTSTMAISNTASGDDTCGIESEVASTSTSNTPRSSSDMQVGTSLMTMMQSHGIISASQSPCVSTSTSSSSCAKQLWFYNYKTEKLEYSGIDSANIPIDPSLACFPASPCACADCLSGRSNFVGHSAKPAFDNFACVYDEVPDIGDINVTKPSYEPYDPLPSFDYNYVPYEENVKTMSGPISSTDSSPAIGNDVGGGHDVVFEPKLPKLEPLDDLDFFFPSTNYGSNIVNSAGFDPINWFDYPELKL
ncbi:hypothetical protein L7F22_010636 [Adiantum nelumboides]|nr:hypothetical protein [Adiantum nelumboides]